jgi:hypothetical protein
MPGRVKAALLLSILLSLPAFADCSQWTSTSSRPFRTTANDVSVDGSSVWVATGYGVQLIEDGSIVASIGLPGSTRVVRAFGNGIAYAGSGASIYVVRRDGSDLTLVNTVSAGGTVNDLEIVATSLFAATSNGVAHFDIVTPAAPFRTNGLLPSSSPNVTSLSASANTLYAADGDSTIEMYTLLIPSIPQHVGTLTSSSRPTAVHATSDNRVFAADRFGTDVFSGGALTSRLSVSATSFAAFTGQTQFVAGADRTIRAIDLSTARVAELYAADLAPTDGTDNVIHAMARSGNTLYVAGGDIGLVTLDITAISRPYPLVNYGGGATTSVQVSGDKAWFSNTAGRISEQRIDAAGVSLTELRAWDAAAGSVVRDSRNDTLLTTSGAVATVWSLLPSPPAQATSVTFAEPISAAVMTDTQLMALLASGSVWSVPNGSTTPQKANVPVTSLLAGAGSALALAEVRASDSTTVIRYYANGDLAAEPQRFTIPGAAAGSLALDATRVAVFTFSGISIVDLATGNIRVIPDSNRIIPRQLVFSGDDLLAFDTQRLLVYHDAHTLVREHTLPADAVALGASGTVAALATFDGTTAIRYLAELPHPETPFANRYYTKLAAGAGRIYLFDDEGIDVFSTAVIGSPRHVAGIPAAGVVDLTASDASLFTLTGNGTVTAYSRAGVVVAQASISEGFDSQALAIRTVGNAVWASIATGCSASGCLARKTLVLDPNTLAVTATMTGRLTDATTSGTRAYALFAFPAEIRVLNISDPLHPAPVVTAAASAFATSIGYASGKVYVLAGKVFEYAEGTLTLVSEHLTALPIDTAQRLRIDGTCAIVTRDTDTPALYNLPSWTLNTAQFTLPSKAQSFAIQPGLLVFLTEHSLELAYPFSEDRPRRRAVR